MHKKVKIRVTEEFSKKYRNLPEFIQKKVNKQPKFLSNNPRHPSLKIHRMNDEWEF